MQKVNYYCTNYNALYADIMAFLFQILRKRSIVLHKGLLETDDFAAQQKQYGSYMFDYLRKKNMTDDFQRLIWRTVDLPIYTIPY